MEYVNYKNQKSLSLLPESGADAPTVLSAVYINSTPAKNRQADVLQYGRSMIEMLGVLAIIGVLSVGGIAGYSKAMQKYRINKAIEQITLIAGNVRAFFAPQSNYEGLSCRCGAWSGAFSSDCNCPIIKKAKILPDEMITVNSAGKITDITNAFGNGVDLDVVDKSANSDTQAFRIEYYLRDSDLEACIELASHDWTATGVKGIRVFDIGPVTGGYITVPGSLDRAVDICSKTLGGSEYTSLRFFFDVSDNCWNETNGYTCLTASQY